MTLTTLLRAEWLKFRSLPALLATALLLFAVTAGFSAMGAATLGREQADRPGFDSLSIMFYGMNFGQVVALCLGATWMAAQLRDNGQRVWLTAVPRRGLFFSAGLIVLGAVVFTVGAVSGLVSFLAAQPVLEAPHPGLGDPVAWRAFFGCAAYLALLALLAAGVAMLLNSGALAMGILAPAVLLLSFTLGDVGASTTIVSFLPDRAGRQMLLLHPSETLGPWAGLAVTTGWTAAAIGAGWTALRRRDL
ncbi:hypothetical protein [Nocardia lijiangensis]|uniref:hypothetical protein n=1 Tax=Nocardia lijiangensis TaxID=299618 RepID=UPI003D7444C4